MNDARPSDTGSHSRRTSARIARETGQNQPMSDRYNVTDDSNADEFFGDATESTMSTSTSDNTSGNSATTSDNDDPAPVANETSDLYIAVGHLKAVASAFVKAHPTLDLSWGGQNDSDLHVQVRYVKALHEVKKALGKRQREHNEVAIGFGSDEYYAAAFGNELPTIETDAIDGGVLATLESREGSTDEWEAGDAAELGQGLTVLLPAVDGQQLPAFVANEDALNAALALVGELPTEPAVAEHESAEGAEEGADAFFEDDEAQEAVANADSIGDGMPNPGDMSVSDIRSFVSRIDSAEDARLMLESEQAGKARKTAIKALSSRRNALDGQREATDDDVAEATPESASSDADAKAELANQLIADGMSPADAIEQVRSL